MGNGVLRSGSGDPLTPLVNVERLLPRETSGRLLGEVRRTSSEPSGAVDTSLGLSDKQWEL